MNPSRAFGMMAVAEIHTYPVKGLRGFARASAPVEPWGLAGDRRWLVVDGSGTFLTQRQIPAMATVIAAETPDQLSLIGPDGGRLSVQVPRPPSPPVVIRVWNDEVRALDGGDAAAAFLSDALGIACRLVYMHAPAAARPVDAAYGSPDDHVSFADAYPLLLTTTASLSDLNGRLAEPVPMGRFRPNLVVDGATAWAEDGWRFLKVGTTLFEAVKPCTRCVVTTLDQETGQRSAENEPIRTLQRFRRDARGQVLFGQNLIPRSGGTIYVGDAVTIVT